MQLADNWLQILSFVIPTAALFITWIAKNWIKQIIEEMGQKVETMTAPIQKEANGGWSLPDAIRLLTKIDSKMDMLNKDIAHLTGRFDNHLEEGSHEKS